MIGEVGDATERGGAEQDTGNDFGNDGGLLDVFERPAEGLGDGDDDDELDDEEGDGLFISFLHSS